MSSVGLVKREPPGSAPSVLPQGLSSPRVRWKPLAAQEPSTSARQAPPESLATSTMSRISLTALCQFSRLALSPETRIAPSPVVHGDLVSWSSRFLASENEGLSSFADTQLQLRAKTTGQACQLSAGMLQLSVLGLALASTTQKGDGLARHRRFILRTHLLAMQ